MGTANEFSFFFRCFYFFVEQMLSCMEEEKEKKNEGEMALREGSVMFI